MQQGRVLQEAVTRSFEVPFTRTAGIVAEFHKLQPGKR
jgi:hypothetical protein